MSTSKTKLGPWKTSHNGTSVVMANDKTYKLVASVYGDRDDCYPDDAMLANARLIAAAPELYGALMGCALLLRAYENHHLEKGDREKADRNGSCAEVAEAALKKARGE